MGLKLNMALIPILPFMTSFCIELEQAKALRSEVLVERVLEARLEQRGPVEPFKYLQSELKNCGYDMPIPNIKNEQSGNPR